MKSFSTPYDNLVQRNYRDVLTRYPVQNASIRRKLHVHKKIIVLMINVCTS